MLYWINLIFVRKLDDSSSSRVPSTQRTMHPNERWEFGRSTEHLWLLAVSVNLIKFSLLICILKRFIAKPLHSLPLHLPISASRCSSAFVSSASSSMGNWIANAYGCFETFSTFNLIYAEQNQIESIELQYLLNYRFLLIFCYGKRFWRTTSVDRSHVENSNLQLRGQHLKMLCLLLLAKSRPFSQASLFSDAEIIRSTFFSYRWGKSVDLTMVQKKFSIIRWIMDEWKKNTRK